ncbi:MAG TPA: G1 family glutamic endopeptidase, partial [Steroidobacteraceae bacterium]|nr:G1 family glutamic endopeptidase [Steroidobacteraceae bacterium]
MKPFKSSVLAAVLGIAAAGMMMPGAVRAAGAPDSKPQDAATVARAHAAFHKYMSSHRPMLRSYALPVVSSGGATELGSFNWSGFADIEGGANTVSSVSGEWVIPYVECPRGNYQLQDTIIAQWVGIDGAIDDTVEQLGTVAWCFEGVTYYYVWYEMFPAGMVEEGTVACINNNTDCPQPGDRIAASVTVAPGGNYTLSLTDFNRPQESFSVTATCAPSVCTNSSAEWIVERAAFEQPFGPLFIPLVDFFQTGFSNGTLTSGGKTSKIEGFTDGGVYDIAMI